MSSYFRPLRRKIGVVTLALACVFAAGWVRSGSSVDTLELNRGLYRYYFQSSNGILMCASFGQGVRSVQGRATQLLLFENEGKKTGFDRDGFVEWDFRFAGFSKGGVQPYKNGSTDPRSICFYGIMRIWCIPYWSLAIPLTLLSAYLLLSKPRTSNPNPASEP